MRPYVRGIFLILVVLTFWRFGLRQKITLGYLPGDLNFATANLHFHAPIATCMLVSFLANAIGRSLQR